MSELGGGSSAEKASVDSTTSSKAEDPLSLFETSALSVQIVSIDYYRAPSVSSLDEAVCRLSGRVASGGLVPVLRVFGRSFDGFKTCVHIHRVFPYLYVEYRGNKEELTSGYVQGFAAGLDNALHQLFEKDMAEGQGHLRRQSSSTTPVSVHDIELVSAIPFYGFHESTSLFLRVSFYDPATITRAANLLRTGAVLRTCFRVYEAHLQYILQFMVDYNLHGMNYLHLEDCLMREPFPSGLSFSTLDEPRRSTCELEVDVLPKEIRNSLVSLRVPPSPVDTNCHVRLVTSLIEIWQEEQRRREKLRARMRSSRSAVAAGSDHLTAPEARQPLGTASPQQLDGHRIDRVADGLDHQKNRLHERARAVDGVAVSAVGAGFLMGTVKTSASSDEPPIVKPFLSSSGSGSGTRSGTHHLSDGSPPLKRPQCQSQSQNEIQSLNIDEDELCSILEWMEGLGTSENEIREHGASQVSETEDLCNIAEANIVESLSQSGKPRAASQSPRGHAEILSQVHDEWSSLWNEVQDSVRVDSQLMKVDKENSKTETSWMEGKIPQYDGSGDRLRERRERDRIRNERKKVLMLRLEEERRRIEATPTTTEPNSVSSRSDQLSKKDQERRKRDSLIESYRSRRRRKSASVAEEEDSAPFVLRFSPSPPDLDVSPRRLTEGAASVHIRKKPRLGSAKAPIPIYDPSSPPRSHHSAHSPKTRSTSVTSTSTSPGLRRSGRSSLEHPSWSVRARARSQEDVDIDQNQCVLVPETPPQRPRPRPARRRRQSLESPGLPAPVVEEQMQIRDREPRDSPSLSQSPSLSLSGIVSPMLVSPGFRSRSRRNDGALGLVGGARVRSSGVRFPVLSQEQNRAWVWKAKPPAADAASLFSLGIAPRYFPSPYYSNPDDLPPLRPGRKPLRFANLRFDESGLPAFRHKADTAAAVPLLNSDNEDDEIREAEEAVPRRCPRLIAGFSVFTLSRPPPPPRSCDAASCIFDSGRKRTQLPSAARDHPSRIPSTSTSSMPLTEAVAQGEGAEKDDRDRFALPFLTLCAVEIIASTPLRDRTCADPSLDPVLAIAIAVASGDRESPIQCIVFTSVYSTLGGFAPVEKYHTRVVCCSDEKSMLKRFALFVREEIDPDCLIGFEIQNESIGYILARGRALDEKVKDSESEKRLSLHWMLSREALDPIRREGRGISFAEMRFEEHVERTRGGDSSGEEGDEPDHARHSKIPATKEGHDRHTRTTSRTAVSAAQPGAVGEGGAGRTVRHSTGGAAERVAFPAGRNAGILTRIPVKENQRAQLFSEIYTGGNVVVGRVLINLWRILVQDCRLQSYTMEAATHDILGRRLPFFTPRTLTRWCRDNQTVGRALAYIAERAHISLDIMERLDIVGQTSESARVFGIDFFSVISRGTQFKVESMMARLVRCHGFLLYSPTKEDVQRQRAPECLALVMEPEVRFFTHPVVVLDFASLYPSVMIAYNYCFCTCLGVLSDADVATQKNTDAPITVRLGVTDLSIPGDVFQRLLPHLIVAPNGVLFVKSSVRRGVLPQLLAEILDTRAMVKHAMRDCSGRLKRKLDARQLSLKLIANVTYGYTSAGYSGRMPCIDIADAIVQTGRETLERAIRLIEKDSRFAPARVVYADTDSLFVHLPGRDVGSALDLGKKMCELVGQNNPPPVRLKLEKVYCPCFLLAKKRYVGWSYEDGKDPVLDAKGIETIRRDSCPVVASVLEGVIRRAFSDPDISAIRQFVVQSLEKIVRGDVRLDRFMFNKEVRLGTYSPSVPPPPAAMVAARIVLKEGPRAASLYGVRVPYVVVAGPPDTRLVDLVHSPRSVLRNPSKFRVNTSYYIMKQILPSLQRVLGTLGVDVFEWWESRMSVSAVSTRSVTSILVIDPRAGRRAVHALDPSRHPELLEQGEADAQGPKDAGGFDLFPVPRPLVLVPRPPRVLGARAAAPISGKQIETYFRSSSCLVCGGVVSAQSVAPLCSRCLNCPQESFFILTSRRRVYGKRLAQLISVCKSCVVVTSSSYGSHHRSAEEKKGKILDPIRCKSLDCPLYFERCRLSQLVGAMELWFSRSQSTLT